MVVIAVACAKPQIYTPIAYSAPIVAAAPLTASSAVVSREFHGNTAPYVAAYPYFASPYAYTAPVLL